MASDLTLFHADPLRAAGVTSRDLLRETRAGHLVRVSHGRYVSADAWAKLDDLGRHRVKTRAVASSASTDNVYSLHAAAALWRISLLGGWPEKIDVVGVPRSGGRSSEQIRRRRSSVAAEDILLVDGLRATSPAQTVADLARILPFTEAVAAIDSACWLGRRSARAELGRVRLIVSEAVEGRGHRRAMEAAAAATDLSESLWESVSRMAVRELGFPEPVLQHSFRWDGSTSYRVDFWWPDAGVIGEFDGLIKYSAAGDDDLREILVREKIREDRLRTMSSGFVRWTAADVRDPSKLQRLLMSAGLRPDRRATAYATTNRG